MNECCGFGMWLYLTPRKVNVIRRTKNEQLIKQFANHISEVDWTPESDATSNGNAVLPTANGLLPRSLGSSSSSLSSLPSGRSRRPMAPLLPVLSFFLEFTVS